MSKLNDKKSENKNVTWDFEDYAFAVATVLFFALTIVGLVFANHSIETLKENLLLAFDGDIKGRTKTRINIENSTLSRQLIRQKGIV